MRDAKDVRIDCKRRLTEGNGEHDARGLAPDTGERFELFPRFRYAPGMPFRQSSSGGNDVLGLRSEKPARLNQTFDIGEPRRG